MYHENAVPANDGSMRTDLSAHLSHVVRRGIRQTERHQSGFDPRDLITIILSFS